MTEGSLASSQASTTEHINQLLLPPDEQKLPVLFESAVSVNPDTQQFLRPELPSYSNSDDVRSITSGGEKSISDKESTATGAPSMHNGVDNKRLAKFAKRQGYQPAFSKIRLNRSAGLFALTAFVIMSVFDGEYSGWNFASDGGIGAMLVAFFVITVMYGCYLPSLAELASVFPFAGGSYGYVRGTMGKTPGLLVLLCDIAEYLIGASATTISSGALLAQLFYGDDPQYAVVWAMLFTFAMALLLIFGGGRMYQFVFVLTVMSVLVLLIYIFGGFRYINWYQEALVGVLAYSTSSSGSGSGSNTTSGSGSAVSSASSSASMSGSGYGSMNYNTTGIPTSFFWFPEQASGVFNNLTYAIWFFLGLEIAPFLSEDVKSPSRTVPRAMLSAYVILVVLAFLTLIVGVSIYPGIGQLNNEDLPLSSGFSLIFSGYSNPHIIALIQLTTFLGGAITFLFAGVRVLFAAGRAGFLPAFLCYVYGRDDAPIGAVVVGSFICYLCVLIASLPSDATPSIVLLDMSIIAALMSLSFKMVAFIILRYKFASDVLHRPFYSPLGITGAVIALAIAIMSVVCVFVFQPTSLVAVYILIACIVWIGLGSIYYAVYGKSHLFLSPEENAAIRLQYRENIETAMKRIGKSKNSMAVQLSLPAEFFRLNAVFQDPGTLRRFESFLRSIFSHENLLFHIEVVNLRATTDSRTEEEFREACLTIYETYLTSGAILQINISAEKQEKISSILQNDGPVPHDIFEQADYEVLTLLHYDSLRKFEEAELHPERYHIANELHIVQSI